MQGWSEQREKMRGNGSVKNGNKREMLPLIHKYNGVTED